MSLSKVFVYGTLKKGFGNHVLLTRSKFIKDETIKGEMRHLGGFPAITLLGNHDIHGEIYEVDENTLHRLDQLEGHPHFYQRSEVTTSEGTTWVYTMSPENLTRYPLVKNGTWGE